MFVPINLNEKIKVKLSDKAKNIYYHRHDKLIEAGATYIKQEFPKVDEDGFTTMQLWEFMQIYGPHIKLGMPYCVTENNNIYVDIPESETATDKPKYRHDSPDELKNRIKKLEAKIQRLTKSNKNWQRKCQKLRKTLREQSQRLLEMVKEEED